MADSEIIISLENLKKSFKNVPVLKGVDLSIRKGSIFALLGSNGAGKTTTVKIMSTLIKQDSGKLEICGYDVAEQAEKVREKISLTGQFTAVDEVLTGRENLQMMGELYHLPKPKERATALLKQFDLESAADRRVSTYSGGMRRRLDIAMSITGTPAVIFLDEPTTGLDPQSRASMWNVVKSLAESGTTVFLTTQYLEEAEVLADKIAILDSGVIVAEGTAEELKQNFPQGIIEFSFQKEADLFEADILLKNFSPKQNIEMLTLTIITDGSIEQLTEVFNCINENKISIASFTQKLPTLEDVFFAAIQ